MNLVNCVQMVPGRVKLDNHFVMNVIMGNLQGEKELPAVVNVVSRIFIQFHHAGLYVLYHLSNLFNCYCALISTYNIIIQSINFVPTYVCMICIFFLDRVLAGGLY